MSSESTANVRRPLKTRSQAWASWLAKKLVQGRVEPNHVSILSIAFAFFGSVFLWVSPAFDGGEFLLLMLAAAACIQLRLVCNMLDGMMAVEGGRATKTGVMFNEVPDRFADVFLIAGAGYAISGDQGILLGWVCACLALGTAYLRAFGASEGLGQDFCGPMAKPHRMFTLTMGCLIAGGTNVLGMNWPILKITLVIMLIGLIVTCARRICHIMRGLEAK